MMAFEVSPEQQQLEEAARRFAAEEIVPVAAKHDEEQLLPAIAKKAWELGLMNLEVPAEHGGPEVHAMRIATDAVQIFGGYGYMKEVSGREADGGREAAPDLRGDESGAADRHRPQSPEMSADR